MDTTDLVLEDLSYLDITTGSWRRGSLRIRDGRFVTETSGGGDQRSCTVLRLSGLWAVPSFVDMHAHVTLEPRAHEFSGASASQDHHLSSTFRAVRNLTEGARAGIALIRDMGGDEIAFSNLRKSSATAIDNLPELVTSGVPVCHIDGHASTWGRTLMSLSEDVFLETHGQKGHEWVKVMNGPELWPDHELANLVKRAHSFNLRVAVHAFTPEGIRGAVAAGADTVEHGLVCDEDLAELAKQNNTWFVPTAYCSWISLRPRYTLTQPPSEVTLLDYWFSYLEESFPSHLESGLSVLPGTDAGSAPCSFDDYVHELVFLAARWHIPPSTVLRAATLDAAEVLGRSSDYGSIAPGKLACIVVSSENPLENLATLRHPELVLLRGSAVLNALGEAWS